MSRLGKAFRAFWSILTRGEYPALPEAEAVETETGSESVADTEETSATPEPPKGESATENKTECVNQGAAFALKILQREGRLIDFLQEGIDGYSDEQVGAAVRQIHAGCRKALEKHFTLEPILTVVEGETTKLDDAFDPARIALTGSVPDEPPYQGVVEHKGWVAASVQLPERNDSVDPYVVCQAEVSCQ